MGLFITVGVHLLFGLLLFFVAAWREPDPPIPEYGIEVNFGMSQEGSGTVQTEEAPAQQPDEQAQEQPEETPEETTEQQEPAEEAPEEAPTEQPDPTQESEAELEAQTQEAQPEQGTEEPATQESAPEPEQSQPAESNPSGSNTPAVPEYPTSGGQNQGNDPDAVGDKGDPKGEINESTVYQGPSGSGTSYSLSGWKMDADPEVEDKSAATGKIVFNIKVNSDGEVMSVFVKESTVNAAVASKYREAVLKLTFTATSDNANPKPISEGTITFILKAKN